MKHLALMIIFAVGASAQVADGITTIVNRTVNIAPDEADFVVTISTTLDTTQQQVTQVFQDAGIQNLTVGGIAAGPNNSSYPPPNDSQLYYQIAFTTAPSALKDFTTKLDAMRANLPSTLTALQYGAALNASQAAVDAAHQTALPQLLQDAKARGQALATAAGLKLGAITGVSESNSGTFGAVANQWFVSGIVSFSTSPSNAGTQYTFYATVKFTTQQP